METKKSRSGSRIMKRRKTRTSRKLLAELIQKKKLADKNKKGAAFCVTRTVEWAASQEVGQEKSKLISMIALGLTPKMDKVMPNPTVKVEKLDPVVVVCMEAVTRKRLDELIESRRRRNSKELCARASAIHSDPKLKQAAYVKLELLSPDLLQKSKPRGTLENTEIIESTPSHQEISVDISITTNLLSPPDSVSGENVEATATKTIK